MSRIVVKNLPKNINEEKLRKLFSENGTITDVQLKYTKNGKFRQFAFVGFKEEHEAVNAINVCNNTYIATNKITVEDCAALGNKKSKNLWSKQSSENTNKQKVAESLVEEKKEKASIKNKEPSEKQKLLQKYKNDPLFKEYVDVHPNMKEIIKDGLNSIELPTEGGQQYDDSEIQSSGADESEVEETDEKIANKEISDLEYMKQLKAGTGKKKKIKVAKEKVQLFTVKLKGLPYNCKKKDIKGFFKPNTPYSIRVPRKIHGIAYAGFRTEKKFKKALLKDRSFVGGKQISVIKYDYKDNTSGEDIKNDEPDTRQIKWKNQEELLKNEEDIGESGRIFVRNLAYTATEDDIEKLFSQYGLLTEVNLPIDSASRKMKGFGMLTFLMPEHAVKAYTELDGTVFQGRMLHLLPGKSKDEEGGNHVEDESNYKKKKQAKLKSQANSTHNWNSLFLGHDAVAEVIADTYGKSKEHLLAPHGDGSAAVRLALGETQIVVETRKYLEKEGVVLDAFSNDSIQRSKRILLVKNLPARTEVKELHAIFEKHGVVNRIILPPSGITAIVEFEEPSEARKAYLKLAYSKFKHVPLFLEWAPERCLSQSLQGSQNTPTTQDNLKISGEASENVRDFEENQTTEESNSIEKLIVEDEEPEPDTTLFVKNLNFQTTDDILRKHFEVCGKINYATVATKKDKNNPSGRLSMGYGFVRFYRKASTDKALKTLQQSSLDGKSLELKRSERTLQSDVIQKKVAKKTKQTGSKIMVKNIPFQANRKELFQLFGVFGEIKSLRLPKKMSLDSESHRGFGFVDYVTASDAKNAFESLSQSTHLYGRRLVLEWASPDDESVEQIRKRTADHFKPSEEVKSKKSVFSLEEEEV